MSRTPEQDIAACRAFALQMRPYTVSRVLNDAADQIERLAKTLSVLSEHQSLPLRGE